MKLTRWDTREVIFELNCGSWEELLKGALKARISFYRANFSGSDFSESNFRGSDFSESDFSESDFSGSDFSWSDFSGSDFSESDFSESDFRGSNFSGSNFRGSDFRGSDFSGSDFRGLDFRKSRHQYKIGNMREWHSMQLDRYMIVFDKNILAIGCQQHSIKKWKEFSDKEISNMDKAALDWWNKWKDFIFKAIELCEKG